VISFKVIGAKNWKLVRSRLEGGLRREEARPSEEIEKKRQRRGFIDLNGSSRDGNKRL
jgi:hypothetical protein